MEAKRCILLSAFCLNKNNCQRIGGVLKNFQRIVKQLSGRRRIVRALENYRGIRELSGHRRIVGASENCRRLRIVGASGISTNQLDT